jgi:SOS-response transcriptional repressor LexA
VTDALDPDRVLIHRVGDDCMAPVLRAGDDVVVLRGGAWRHADVVLARTPGCPIVRRVVQPSPDDAELLLAPLVFDGDCAGVAATPAAVVGPVVAVLVDGAPRPLAPHPFTNYRAEWL